MIEIKTRDFGLIQVAEDAVYDFEEGLYGFEDCKKFAIFDRPFDDISFLYLQATNSEDPCFLIFEPWDYYEQYSPVMSPEDLESLEVSSVDDLVFVVIATIPREIQELSMNIKSPVVLNPKTQKGKQVILLNKEYPIRFKPFQERTISERMEK